MISSSQNPPDRRKRVTVRDIAVAAGVHHTTVSLALRNSPLLNAETRARLRSMAEEMGYVPDPMLNALVAYRRASFSPRFQAVLIWINNWPQREELQKNPTFHDYYQGAQERARQLGYLLEEIWLRESGMTPEKLRRIIRARGIQGMILAPQPFARTWPNIDFEGVPSICFGYSMQPAVLHLVTNHHYHTMGLMFSHLVELGYRRIGVLISEDWDNKVDNTFTAGWLISSRKFADKVVAIPPYQSPLEDTKKLKKWLGKHKPDVIIGRDDDLDLLERLGYAVPQELGFASLDMNARNSRVSGVYENSFLIGQKAVDILVGMIHRSECGVPETPIRTLVEGVWVPGST
ncbi:MAG: LacI family DNA-binding transcriptional regulator, partial [Rhodospirillales bacterium]|nr:LacI family DNA-binding transcriptional regulator [Acetobacter sp.]